MEPITLVQREASLSLAKIAFCPLSQKRTKRLMKLLSSIDNVALVGVLYGFAQSALKVKIWYSSLFLRAYEVAEPLIAGVQYTKRLGRRNLCMNRARRSMNERAPVCI